MTPNWLREWQQRREAARLKRAGDQIRASFLFFGHHEAVEVTDDQLLAAMPRLQQAVALSGRHTRH